MSVKLERDCCVVAWRAEDVQTLRPDWSEERCVQFLESHEDDIQCAMIERGWSVIEDLLRWEDNDVST
jgi:hypothetical protein